MASIRCPICGYGRYKKVDVERRTYMCKKQGCGCVYRYGDGIVPIEALHLSMKGAKPQIAQVGENFADSVVIQRNVFLGNEPIIDRALSGEKALVVGEVGSAVAARMKELGWKVQSAIEVDRDSLSMMSNENDVVIVPNAYQVVDLADTLNGIKAFVRGGGFLIISMLTPEDHIVANVDIGNVLIDPVPFVENMDYSEGSHTFEVSNSEYCVWVRKE